MRVRPRELLNAQHIRAMKVERGRVEEQSNESVEESPYKFSGPDVK